MYITHVYIYIYTKITLDPNSLCAQENVGRQGSFPHGIDIVTLADYFTVRVPPLPPSISQNDAPSLPAHTGFETSVRTGFGY